MEFAIVTINPAAATDVNSIGTRLFSFDPSVIITAPKDDSCIWDLG